MPAGAGLGRGDGPPAEPDSVFARDTAVRPVEGGFVGEISPRWNVGSNPNGGYTLALAGRAMLASCGRPDPLTVTAHYVAPPGVGPVTVRTGTVRAGRRYATVAASMIQGDRELIRLLGAFGDLGALEGPTRIGAVMPVIPLPEDCVALDALSPGRDRSVPEIMRRYDLRIDPGCQWARAQQGRSGTGDAPVGPLELAGWTRFADGAPPSVVGLLAMADAFPPTVIGSVDVGWVPTVELTVHVRSRPTPGWILGVARTRFLVDGMLEIDGELWDEAGRLVAMCRQLGLVLPRR
jgi:acyl-CoA thioesterase